MEAFARVQNHPYIPHKEASQHGMRRCFAGDVRNSENCSAAVALAVETYGGLDVLVNAAAGEKGYYMIHID